MACNILRTVVLTTKLTGVCPSPTFDRLDQSKMREYASGNRNIYLYCVTKQASVCPVVTVKNALQVRERDNFF